MTLPAVIRPAAPDDAAGCAFVHHTSWVETYSRLLPADHWETDTLERRTARWQRRLDDGAAVTVAERGGQVVGFAIDGQGRRIGDHEPVRDRELLSLYVLSAHHGTGVGQALLDAVVAPGTPAQPWVAEDNPRARRFYGRNGFLPDGAGYVDDGLGLAEVRLVR
ncbi:GNAT family N-acetyltransferase [Isoptericola sp. BMS4]|uniref:GNAT family N-acetyltransferase n=1 Tax=Isoptericola sp. BMS4 TaxID=2527875 RepID=UPI0014204B88|nr:GNAT family N-acetyltransferase [Isoptericola sp. BMS4]